MPTRYEDLPILDPAASPASAPVIDSFPVTPLRVEDGDTFRVDTGPNVNTLRPTIRLYGVDAPELDGPEPERAQAAKDFVSAAVALQNLDILFYQMDPYGRFVAQVYSPLVGDLGTALVAEGLVSSFPPKGRPLPFNAPHPVPADGRSEDVIDGDTLIVRLQGLETFDDADLRLYFLDAAETLGPYPSCAGAALLYVRDTVLGTTGTLHLRGRDRYGRLLGSYEVPGTGDLVDAMITAGVARYANNPYPPVPFDGDPIRLRLMLKSCS